MHVRLPCYGIFLFISISFSGIFWGYYCKHGKISADFMEMVDTYMYIRTFFYFVHMYIVHYMCVIIHVVQNSQSQNLSSPISQFPIPIYTKPVHASIFWTIPCIMSDGVCMGYAALLCTYLWFINHRCTVCTFLTSLFISRTSVSVSVRLCTFGISVWA
jgi:hypothetical protein